MKTDPVHPATVHAALPADSPSNGSDRRPSSAMWPNLTIGGAWLDIGLRACTALALSLFLGALYQQFMLHPARLTLVLMAIAECITVSLAIFTRIPRERDWSPFSVLVSMCGTFYFLAFQIAPGLHLVPEWFAVTLQSVGILVQISAKLSLRRSFGILPANRGVVILGPYRLVRHPMYLGYLISDLGFILANFGIRNLALIAFLVCFQIARILREERLLTKDAQYREYMNRVKFRLIPGIV